jgi:exodeoxyribonuclease VII small subunit
LSPADPERLVPPPGFEDVLTTLEKTIAELAGGTAPLEELVAAHQRALVLLAEAQARLDELKVRADQIARQLT